MDIPIYTYELCDPDAGGKMSGFIAQEVETIIPEAVKTTVAPIPNILRRPNAVSDDGLTLCLESHGLLPGAVIKIIAETEEIIAKITNTTEHTFTLNTPLKTQDPQQLFVYGEIVSDFKLLDSERLLPYVFGAIKELNSLVIGQQNTIDSILTRLYKLENP